MVDIRLKELLSNLKNWDFDICGSYKVDEMEAKKIIEAIQEMDEHDKEIDECEVVEDAEG